jgi:hypothetical protein
LCDGHVLFVRQHKKWPGLEIWNFANFFTEDVKKNHIFPQFWGYIAIYLVPVGGQLCVLGDLNFLTV